LRWQELKTKGVYNPTPTSLVRTSAHSDYNGAGLRGGIELRYALYRGWSITGLGSVSLLYGSFFANFSEKQDEAIIAKSPDHFRSGVASAQLAVGIQWDTFFHHEDYHFGGRISWEQNMWFAVNRMQHWKNTLNTGIMEQEKGDLSLQGLTFSARLDF
jgi:hypothetical protein